MNDSGITLEKLVPGFSDFTDSLKKDIGRQLALRGRLAVGSMNAFWG
jgi:hypothetical protein